jgi:adenylylsulfate kinase
MKGSKIKMNNKRAMFVGRWQPFHNGHKWLIDNKLSGGTPILIAVRDIPPDEKNPFTTDQTIEMIEAVYDKDDVIVMSIPDIESVNYGRGVGYEINEFTPPEDIWFISATNIRNCILNDDKSWENKVDSKIHGLVEEFLTEGQMS